MNNYPLIHKLVTIKFDKSKLNSVFSGVFSSDQYLHLMLTSFNSDSSSHSTPSWVYISKGSEPDVLVNSLNYINSLGYSLLRYYGSNFISKDNYINILRDSILNPISIESAKNLGFDLKVTVPFKSLYNRPSVAKILTKHSDVVFSKTDEFWLLDPISSFEHAALFFRFPLLDSSVTIDRKLSQFNERPKTPSSISQFLSQGIFVNSSPAVA